MKPRHLAVLTAAPILVLSSDPAFAAGPPYTVTVGANTSGTYNVSFTHRTDRPFVIKIGELPVTCTDTPFSGFVVAGANINPVINITNFAFTGCTISGTAASNVATTSAIQNFTGTGTNATSGIETVTGYTGNIERKFQAGSLCSFSLQGTATSSFNESTQRVTINEVPTSGGAGNLDVVNRVGCGGQAGPKATLQVTLAMASTSGAVRLS